MEKVFQTKSGIALYFDFRENTYYTSNYEAVRDALRQDLFSGFFPDAVNAFNILTTMDSFIRLYTLH